MFKTESVPAMPLCQPTSHLSEQEMECDFIMARLQTLLDSKNNQTLYPPAFTRDRNSLRKTVLQSQFMASRAQAAIATTSSSSAEDLADLMN